MQTQTKQHLKSTYYLDTLMMRHVALSSILEEQYKYPFKDPEMIHYLKLEKLKLKDEIERLKEDD